MWGQRGAGLLGASVAAAAAAGAAYLLWTRASPSGRSAADQSLIVDQANSKEVVMDVRKTAAPSVSRPAESEGRQVLVLGLDGAGKSSLLHCLATGSLNQDMLPTQGLNAVSINRENLHIEFQEIGGKEDLRPYWQRYLSQALLLVFVVDSSDPWLFPVAKKHLHELLSCQPRLPLMLLANKQDLPGSCSIADVHDALSLSDIGERQLFLLGTHVRKGDTEWSSGVQDAWELIVHMVCGDR